MLVTFEVALERISKAQVVFAGVMITPDDIMYVRVAKKDARWAINRAKELQTEGVLLSTVDHDGSVYFN